MAGGRGLWGAAGPAAACNTCSTAVPGGKVGQKVAVVVSAMGGKPKVTDLLLSTLTMAAQGDLAGAVAVLTQIEKKHMDAIQVRGVHRAPRCGGAGNRRRVRHGTRR